MLTVIYRYTQMQTNNKTDKESYRQIKSDKDEHRQVQKVTGRYGVIQRNTSCLDSRSKI